jgi:hypothetical protein
MFWLPVKMQIESQQKHYLLWNSNLRPLGFKLAFLPTANIKVATLAAINPSPFSMSMPRHPHSCCQQEAYIQKSKPYVDPVPDRFPHSQSICKQPEKNKSFATKKPSPLATKKCIIAPTTTFFQYYY